jgi:hypothetical protein
MIEPLRPATFCCFSCFYCVYGGIQLHLARHTRLPLFLSVFLAAPALAMAQTQTGAPASSADSSATTAVASTTGSASAPADANVSAAEPSADPSALETTIPARLSDVEGSVRIEQIPPPAAATDASQTGAGMPPAPPQDTIFKQALVNMPVMAGMQIQTGDDGRAELEFTDGSIVRVTPDSVIQVNTLGGGGEQLRAISGLSYYELPDRSNGLLAVEVGPYRVQLQQGALLRLDLDTAPYQAAVVRGSAHFNSAALDIGFEATVGQTVTLDPASANAYDLKQEVASNSWDDWNIDRDQSLALMAAGQTSARSGAADSGDAAWNYLDYYGTWYNVPGAGMAWSPDGVDTDFDPYGAGAWGYYPGSGYIWASAYPWGWLPYRCGGWTYFPQFGWMWQPGGGCGFGGIGWYPYAGIHHPPPHYRLPRRPLDPFPRTHLGGVPIPRSQPLLVVRRGPAFQFRQTGDTRPEPRSFPVTNTASSGAAATTVAPILPLVAVQPGGFYGGGQGSSFAGGGAGTGGGAGSQHLYGGRSIYTPGSISIPEAPRGLPPPRAVYTAPPRMEPAPAPHASAPAAVPAPAGHGH